MMDVSLKSGILVKDGYPKNDEDPYHFLPEGTVKVMLVYDGYWRIRCFNHKGDKTATVLLGVDIAQAA